MDKCIEPGTIDEEDIIAYVSGESTAKVRDHIARCPACRARADSYAELQSALLARLYRLHCPSPEALRAFAAGRLGGAWRKQVSQHVRDCVHCREELETIREYDDLARRGTLGQALRQLLQIVRVQTLPVSPQPVGLRGPTIAPQMFRAQAANVDVVLTPLPGEQGGPPQTLVGQLIPHGEEAERALRSFEGAVVELRKGGRLIAEATVDTSGGFTLPLSGTGKYEIRIYLGDMEIRGLWVQI